MKGNSKYPINSKIMSITSGESPSEPEKLRWRRLSYFSKAKEGLKLLVFQRMEGHLQAGGIM